MFLTRSLRAKTLLSVLIPSALGLLAVAAIALYAYERAARDVVQRRDTELARISAARLSEGLSQYARLLEVVAADKDVQSMDMLRLVSALQEAPSQLDVFDAGVVVYDSDGVAVWLHPLNPQRRGTEFPLPSRFDDVRETSRPTFSDVFQDEISNEDAILVAVPVVGDNGEFLGVVAGMATIRFSGLGAVYAEALQFTTGKSGYAYLVDGNGTVIFHRDTSELGKSYAELPPVMRAGAGEIGAVLSQDETGKTVVSGFAPIPETSWGLVTQEDWQDIVGPIRGYSNLLLALLLLTGVSSGALVFFSIGRVLRPVQDLTRAAQRIAEGDFDYALPPETGDEIEALGRQFNVMARALKESYRELERRVADRTRELAALNAIAAVVSSSLDLEEILNDALDKTLEVMGIEAGGIYLLQGAESEDDEGILTIAAHKGLSPQFVAGIDHLKAGEGFSGHVVRTGEPLVVPDLAQDPRLARSVVTETGFRAVAIVPLASREKTWGSLFVVTHADREFSDRDIDLLKHIGDEIGVAIENARLFDAEQRRAEQFRVIGEVGRHIASILDPDQLLKEIARLLKETFGYYQVTVGLIEDDQVVFRAGAKSGWDDPQFLPPPTRAGGRGVTAWVAATGEPLLVPDVSKEPRFLFHPDSAQTRSELAVPMKTKEGVIGVLNVESDRLNAFDESDLAVLQSLANQAAIAIDNAWLFGAEQRRAEQFRVMSEVGHRITSVLAIAALMEEVVRLIKETFGYYLVAIGLIEGDEVVYKAGTGPPFDDPEFRPPRVKVGREGIAGWVADKGEPVNVPDVSQDSRYHFVPQTSVIKSELVVPLKTKGVIIGVLDVQSDELDAFDESDLVLLQSLANQAAVAIDEARLFDAEQRRAEQFRVISEVGARITSILTVDELLSELVRLVKDTLGYYHTAIGLIEGGELVIKAGAGAHWEDPQYEPVRLVVGGQGITAWVAASGEPLLVPDVAAEPRYLALPESTEIRSEVAVPLKTSSGVIGVLDIQSDRLSAFDETDLAVLQSVAQQAAIAIENAQLYEDTSSRLAQVMALQETTRAVASTLDLDKLLSLITEEATSLLQADGGIINLVDWEASEDEVVAATGSVAFALGYRSPLEGSLSGWVSLHDCPVLSSRLEEDSRVDPGALSWIVEGMKRAIRSAAVAPLSIKDQVMGTLMVVDKKGGEGEFDQTDLELLVAFASQAAVAIENAGLYEQAQQAAAMQERSRLARDLHDAVTQTLFSASLIGEVLPTLWESDQDEGRQLLQELRQLTRGALAEMRTLLLELRPAALAEAGLDELLRQLGEAVTGRSGIPVNVTMEGEWDLPPDVHVGLYRIAQEALNNVVKHANASEVAVTLRCTALPDGKDRQKRQLVKLQISDDGCGFDPSCVPPDRLGLGIIRERTQDIGAALRIETQPGSGTKVEVVWQSDREP